MRACIAAVRHGSQRRAGFRRVAFAILRFSGLPLLIRATVQRGAVTIVLFHDPEPGLFARQIAALKRRYSIVSLQSYLDWRAGNASRRLPAKSLIVTFDDGHKGNAALLETLRSEGVPATILLCSGVVGTRRRFWFQHGLPDGEVQKLKLVPDDSRVRTLEHHGFSAEAEFEGRQALSHAEVRSLEPHVDFQAHTVTHPILPNCSSEKAEAEIGHSKKQLEGLGLTINTLSYPNGDYTTRDTAALERAGYTCGITVDPGYNTGETDLFRLRRIGVDDKASPAELIVKASGLIDFSKLLMDRVGRSFGPRAQREAA